MAIIWTNAGILLIWSQATNVSEIILQIRITDEKLFAKWALGLGLNSEVMKIWWAFLLYILRAIASFMKQQDINFSISFSQVNRKQRSRIADRGQKQISETRDSTDKKIYFLPGFYEWFMETYLWYIITFVESSPKPCGPNDRISWFPLLSPCCTPCICAIGDGERV